MRPAITLAFLTAGLLVGTAVRASQPNEFVPPPEMSPEQIRQLKANSRSTLPGYAHDDSDQPAPFPWLAALLGVLTVGGAAPFAWRAYRNTAQEMRESAQGKTSLRQQRSDALDDRD